MPTSLILFLLALACHTDLKRKQIPDTLTMTFLLIALVLGLAETLITGSAIALLQTLAGGLAAYAIGILLQKVAYWHAGDTKLLIAVMALMKLNLHTATYLSAVPIAGVFWAWVYIQWKPNSKEIPFAPAFLLAFPLWLWLG